MEHKLAGIQLVLLWLVVPRADELHEDGIDWRVSTFLALYKRLAHVSAAKTELHNI